MDNVINALLVDAGCFERGCACYDHQDQTPPVEVVRKKEWVGLTYEEMYKVWLSVDEENDRMAFGEAVQAKLKEKNT